MKIEMKSYNLLDKYKKIKENIGLINLLGIIAVIIILIYNFILTYTQGYKVITSDNSAELILGRLLAESNELISKNWFYSTEIRVFNINIIIAIAWKLFNTYDGVMAFSQMILLLLLYISQAYFYKVIGCKYYLVWPIILLMPFSITYFLIVTFGLFYIPHICISFWVLGLTISALANNSRIKIKLALSICISFLSGMGGLRQIVILHLPLLITSLLILISNEIAFNPKKWSTNSKNQILFCFSNTFAVFLGYFVNVKILRESYKFFNWNTVNFNKIDFQVFHQIINDFFSLVGFQDKEIMSIGGIKTAFSICIVIIFLIAIVYSVKHLNSTDEKMKLALLFSITTNICILMLYLFTDMDYADRYLIPSFVFLFPICVFLFEDKKTIFTGMWKQAILIMLGVSIVMVSSETFVFMKNWDRTSELRKVAECLESEGYDFGYATFWNANVLTQLTENKIEVCPILNTERLDKYKWLVSEDTINHIENEKVFLLVSTDELQVGRSSNNLFLDDSKVIFADEQYSIYSFENSEEMYSYVQVE